jgi:acyl carrier protein
MTRNFILDKITALVRVVLNNEEIILAFETVASEVEGWDSLRHIVIISSIEDEFNISIDTKELIKISKVGDICDIVSQKTNA